MHNGWLSFFRISRCARLVGDSLLLSSLVVPAVAQVAGAEAQLAATEDERPVVARHAMVVSIQHDASDAGLQILRAGGNAIDAAVAVGFALAVVYPQAGNIGGGGFMLIHLRDGQDHFIDYREKAPAAATATMYLDAKGNVVREASTVGYRAIGVPGTVAGLTYAEKRYGRLTLAQVMAPAIRLASEGFLLAPEQARTMKNMRNLAQFPESRELFQRNGNFYQPSERFVQPQLAQTLRRIAKDPSTFYTGSMAQELVAAMQKGGGLITVADLATYKAVERRPLRGSYRGYEILTSPPPSSGGIVLLEALNILAGYDLSSMENRTPQQVHYLVEAYRRAYMDRSDYLGDPDFAPMPLQQMANPAYAAAWRKTIDPVAPSPSAVLKRPEGFLPPAPPAVAVRESNQTTHFSIVDAEGNAVSNTYTLNGLFGSGVVAGPLGFLLNNEMDDFTVKVGAPNMFGLVQSAANAIAPGRRPLSSMTPTIVLKNGKVLLVLGSPGGATIITTVANDLISVLDNHLNVQQAADAPRFHHQYLPDRIEFEKAFPLKVVDALKASGYPVNRSNEADEKKPGVWGDSELIYVDPKTHRREGANDRRHRFGKAAGY